MNILLYNPATIINKAFFNTMNWWAFAQCMHWAPSSAPPLKKKMACCPKVRALGPVLSKRV